MTLTAFADRRDPASILAQRYLSGELTSRELTQELALIAYHEQFPASVATEQEARKWCVSSVGRIDCPVTGITYTPDRDGREMSRYRKREAAMIRAVNPTLPVAMLPWSYDGIEKSKNRPCTTTRLLHEMILAYFCRTVTLDKVKAGLTWDRYMRAALSNMVDAGFSWRGETPSMLAPLVAKYGTAPDIALPPGMSHWDMRGAPYEGHHHRWNGTGWTLKGKASDAPRFTPPSAAHPERIAAA